MTGLAVDSRTLAAGEVFLAYPGARHDGRDFIPSALERGATAVLWESEGFEWNSAWRVPNIGVQNLRNFAGPLGQDLVQPLDRPGVWRVRRSNRSDRHSGHGLPGPAGK